MKKKLLALFLCCALSFGLVTAALITPAAADEDFLVYGSDGLVAHTVELAKNNKLALTAVASTGSGVYQWQIQVGGDVWANISGANGVTLDVIPTQDTATYASRVLRARDVYRKYYFPVETPEPTES